MATIRSVISIISSETQNLLVLLLPTKESSFRNRVVKPSASLLELFKNEQSIRTELINFFEEENINYLDVLPILQSAEKQPFNVDSDGHPNTYGYEIIARAVNDSLE